MRRTRRCSAPSPMRAPRSTGSPIAAPGSAHALRPKVTGSGSRYSIRDKPNATGAIMVVVRALVERDLPEAQRIIRDAFGTFLGASDLENFSFPPYAQTRFGAEHIASFAAERDGELLGSNFAIRWGSAGFFAPPSVRPHLDNPRIRHRLVAAACDAFDGWEIGRAHV